MNLRYYKIKKDQTVKNFIKDFERSIKNSNIRFAIKFGSRNTLKGIMSRGDLRRLAEKGYDPKDKIEKFINTKPITVNESDLNNNLYKTIEKKKLTKPKNIIIEDIIVLDKKKRINKILDYKLICDNPNFKKTCVIGLGHIGLPLVIYLLKKFNNVLGYDFNQKKIRNINRRNLDFYEKNLESSLNFYLDQKKLEITYKKNEVYAEIYIICVGSDLSNNRINNENLIKIAKLLSKKIKKNDLIILRGTVQVGGARNIFLKNLTNNTSLVCGKDFYFSYIPERHIAGNALEETEKIPQLVAGYSKNCLDQAVNFAKKTFNNFIELKSIEEGEIIKLLSNSYRDLNFSFSNEIARIANKFGLSGSEVIEKANYGYERNNIAKPSLGVGGFCLPKDPILFEKLAKGGKGYSMGKLSRKINYDVMRFTFGRLIKLLKKSKGNKKVLILGIAFKGLPETVDTRNSSALFLGKFLRKRGIQCDYTDPMGSRMIKMKPVLGINILEKIKNTNIYDLIVMVNNNPYYLNLLEKNLKINNSKNKKFLFDCWNMVDKNYVKNLNWEYHNI